MHKESEIAFGTSEKRGVGSEMLFCGLTRNYFGGNYDN